MPESLGAPTRGNFLSCRQMLLSSPAQFAPRSSSAVQASTMLWFSTEEPREPPPGIPGIPALTWAGGCCGLAWPAPVPTPMNICKCNRIVQEGPPNPYTIKFSSLVYLLMQQPSQLFPRSYLRMQWSGRGNSPRRLIIPAPSQLSLVCECTEHSLITSQTSTQQPPF